ALHAGDNHDRAVTSLYALQLDRRASPAEDLVVVVQVRNIEIRVCADGHLDRHLDRVADVSVRKRIASGQQGGRGEPHYAAPGRGSDQRVGRKLPGVPHMRAPDLAEV